MSKYLITIARQFGSLGRPIAKELAAQLNITYYDRDIVEAAAKKLNLPVSVISDAEEAAKSRFFRMKFPLGNDTTAMQDRLFETQKNIILNLTDKESCIIVGRCSDYILRHEPEHMSIFIYAPYDSRLSNCINTLHMTKAAAKRMISDVDRARDSYHMRYAGFLPSDTGHKQLLIDSSLLGAEETAKALADIIRKRFDR